MGFSVFSFGLNLQPRPRCLKENLQAYLHENILSLINDKQVLDVTEKIVKVYH